jgi:hypothetical protein
VPPIKIGSLMTVTGHKGRAVTAVLKRLRPRDELATEKPRKLFPTLHFARTRVPLPPPPTATLPAGRPPDTGPVRSLTTEEFAKAVAKLQRNLKGWEPLPDWEAPEADAEDDAPSRFTPQAWNARLEATQRRVRLLSASLQRPTSREGFAYLIDVDTPVGLMLLGRPQVLDPKTGELCVEVHNFVTHPGSETAGGALLERAVSYSMRYGGEGRIGLMPLDEEAAKAYRALGFVSADSPYLTPMILNPADHLDIWALVDGEWRLREFLDKKLLDSLAEASPATPGPSAARTSSAGPAPT